MSAVRLILVEDNAADAYLARDILESSTLAIHVDEVADGAAALDFLFRRPPTSRWRAPTSCCWT